MSKKTIALIISLFVITTVLIILAIFPVTERTSLSITPTPIIKSTAETVLAFSPPTISTNSANASGSASYSMDLNILTGKNKVNAAQVELSYDPKELVNVDIKPGDFFVSPVILLKNIDRETGRISYAIAVSAGENGRQGTGTLATLTFKPVVVGVPTTIRFLSKSQVAAEGVQTSVLKSTIDTTIFGGTSSAALSK